MFLMEMVQKIKSTCKDQGHKIQDQEQIAVLLKERILNLVRRKPFLALAIEVSFRERRLQISKSKWKGKKIKATNIAKISAFQET